MLWNKHNLAVAKIASKSDTRPEIASVFFKSDRTVATDTFRLLEISTNSDAKPEDFPNAMRGIHPFLVDAKTVSKIKIPNHRAVPVLNHVAVKHLGISSVEFLTIDDETLMQNTIQARVADGKFPDYESIFPTGEPKAEIIFNGKYLAELLEVVSELSKLHSVTIKIYGSDKPILLFAESETQKARGLLMPVKT